MLKRNRLDGSSFIEVFATVLDGIDNISKVYIAGA